MSNRFFELALLWIVLSPLLAAAVNGAFGRFASKRLAGNVAVGAIAISFALSLAVFIRLMTMESEDPRLELEVYQWFNLGFGSTDIPIRIAFVADSLSGVMLLVVTGIGLLIHVYSLEYMEGDDGYARFFTYLNLFSASMLVLVLGSSMPVMFVGWEGVGLCSYLLIGFWYQNGEYAAAGKKAFIYNRIGDFGVLLGMFILFAATNTLEFSELATREEALTQPFVFIRGEWGMTATIACLFIFLGCTGKSAQIPLYTWLPDAMAGPTPVSALIHAATMVTAGVYLCCRMSSVFVLSPTAMAIIAITGALTALLAASIALVQNQMKKILAYSTVSQLGFMFAAVGSGAFAAGIFHVYTHAFFKACLFLGAGAVMHAVHAHGDADVRKLGGMRKYLPVVHWTFLVSCLAIAGVPLFSGFFSKDEVLLGSLSSSSYYEKTLADLAVIVNAEGPTSYPWPTFFARIQYWMLAITPYLVFAILVLAATMTAFYMFRLYFLTFAGKYRSAEPAHDSHGEEAHDDHAHDEHGHDEHGYDPHPHAPGPRIAIPLVVLGIGAVIAGYVGLPHAFHLPNLWAEWLHGPVATVEGGHEAEGLAAFYPWIAMAAGILAAAIGIGLAYSRYGSGGNVPSSAEPRGFHRVLMNKWYVDELYDWTVVLANRFAAVFAANIDKYFVDGILARLTSAIVTALGWLATRVQNGLVYVYATVMVVGLLAVGWWFTYPHAQLEGEVTGATVEWRAANGLGYRYAWDVDSDGTFEDCATNTCSGEYEDEDFERYVIRITGIRPGDVTELEVDDDPTTIDRRYLTTDWEPTEDGQRWPTVRFEEGKVLLDAGGAPMRVRGQAVTEPVQLGPGDSIQLGMGSARICVVVRGTVRITSAFGNTVEDDAEVIIEPPEGGGQQAALGGVR
jgi:NADH-quinone oxidoreductase subunit L